MAHNERTPGIPLDALFKSKAEVLREALQNFNTVLPLNSASLWKSALGELVSSTVRSSFHCNFSYINSFSKLVFNYHLSFVSHPLFQELVPAAHTAVENFRSKHPDFKLPVSTHMIAGLDARVKDFLNSKKAATPATGLRPEKVKKTKTSVRPSFFKISSP